MRELMRVALALFLAGVFAGPSLANVEVVTLSPDVTVGSSTFTTTDEGAIQSYAAGQAPLDLGPDLPPNAAVIAIAQDPGGATLFALDTHVSLDGTIYRPGDIISWNGTTYALYWDAAAEGLPANARVDGLTLAPGGDLLLTFDIAVVIRGETLQDHDVIQLQSGGGSFVVFSDPFDDYGVRPFDVDGLHWIDGDRLGLSFDRSGLLLGVAFDDEDIVSFDSNDETFALVFDASLAQPELSVGVDVEAIAVPEPGAVALLVAGSLALALLPARRSGA